MRYPTFFLLTILIAALSGFTLLKGMEWRLADSFDVSFDSKNASGSFGELNGSIRFDPDNLEASLFDMAIPVSSIRTGNGLKNRHARGKNWFDAERYPNITFVSKTIRRTGEGYAVDGILQMHGVSKPFTMPFTFADNTFKSRFVVNRSDFGVGSSKGLAKKVPEEIRVDLTVPVLP
jgi:polyisoprenoid-binding protein YceI